MLGKLLKYEYRATARVCLPFLGATLFMACVSRLLRILSGIDSAAFVIGTVLSSFMIAAVCVVALVMAIQQFRRNLLGDEGYLMLTLPVSTDALIFSKLIVAVTWFAVSAVVAVFAILLLAVTDVNEMLRDFARMFAIPSWKEAWLAASLTVEAILAAIGGAASVTLTFYVCLAVPMRANRYRGLLGFGIWIGISTVLQILGVILGTIISESNWFYEWFTKLYAPTAMQLPLCAAIIVELAISAAMYAITRTSLRNNLNLE
ncbi:MAG: hypothetical protein LBT36_00525 [Oscillospiraceae bacterium]|jgi:hypothetical protein|nr:hypothetical protein [Oscillospiraceae bacterium]